MWLYFGCLQDVQLSNKSLVKKLINRKKKGKARNRKCSQEPFHYKGFIPSCLLTVLAIK